MRSPRRQHLRRVQATSRARRCRNSRRGPPARRATRVREAPRECRGLDREVRDALERASRPSSPTVQQDLEPVRDDGALATRSRPGSSRQQASRPVRSRGRSNAAALMNAIAQAGQSFPTLLTHGAKPFVPRSREVPVEGQIAGLVDSLEAFTPQTVSDAGALARGVRQRDRCREPRCSIAQVPVHREGRRAPTSCRGSRKGLSTTSWPARWSTRQRDLSVGAHGLGGAAFAPTIDAGPWRPLFRGAAERESCRVPVAGGRAPRPGSKGVDRRAGERNRRGRQRLRARREPASPVLSRLPVVLRHGRDPGLRRARRRDHPLRAQRGCSVAKYSVVRAW